MKFAVTIFTLLLAVVGGLVFVQFQVYSDQKPVAQQEYMYSQEIEVEHRGDSLDIRHHFKNLPEHELVIDWPANAVDAQCFLETENACKRLNEQMTRLVAGENNSQSISYVIPLKGGLRSGELLKDIFVQLEDGAVKFSTVHITTSLKIDGSWVTGLPLIGYQQLSLVNYAMFTGEGTVKDLYWQKANFSFLTSKDGYSLYSNTGVSKKEQQELTRLKAISDDHISIVKVKKKPQQQGYRILFVEDTNTQVIQRNLTMQQLEQMYMFEQSPNWLKQLVGSVVVGENIGYKKSQQILDEIRAELNEEQLAAFKENLIALEGKKLTPNVIDEQLSNAVGTYTKYISLNAQSDVVYPFVYNDERPIILNDREQPKLHILLKDDRVLYPANALLKALGYKTSEGANGYYVNSDARAYRFPADEHRFYVFNQRRFNISAEPFDYVGNVRYIDEAFVQRIFLVNIEKTDEMIKLTTTAQINE